MSQIWQMSGSEIADAVKSGKLSATEVTKAHLERIDQVNPDVNAIVQHMPEQALQQAAKIDQQISRGEDPGILAGIPVSIKVNVDQAGFANTNGLVMQKDLIAETDSPVVSNIKKAGAVIIGRTNTPAFSLRWFTKNNLHGHTFNPRNKSLTPGGSSGGASASVASGMCPIGHGTDIGGSIRYPAYACGLHGLRPTLGRIPAFNASGGERHIGGQIMAVSGPLAHTMKDIELSLVAMAAKDLRDPWWIPAPINQGEFPKRAALCVNPDGLNTDPLIEKELRNSAEILKQAGWEITETDCPGFQEAADINAILWMAEMRFAAADAIRKEAEPDSTFVFEQMINRSKPVDVDGLQIALQKRASLIRQWQLFTEQYSVLICPISRDLPFADQQDVRSSGDFEEIMQSQLTQIGLPALGLPGIAVATGKADDVPLGIQLIAGRYREDILISAGKIIEKDTYQQGPADPV